MRDRAVSLEHVFLFRAAVYLSASSFKLERLIPSFEALREAAVRNFHDDPNTTLEPLRMTPPGG